MSQRKLIPPLILTEDYFRGIEAEINRIYMEILYKPLAEAMQVKPSAVFNSASELASAVRSGRVWYDAGTFQGKFNSKITKELKKMGATYDKRRKLWKYSGALPVEISFARAYATARFHLISTAVLSKLSEIYVDRINQMSGIPDEYAKTVDRMDRSFKKSVNGLAVPPVLTAEARNVLVADWSMNLDLYIKGWLSDNILKLRKDVEENTFNGRRAEDIVEHIKKNYAVSKRKAKFLARQETALLMSKFREQRYKSIGVTTYIWSGVMDEKERPDHVDLEGERIQWSDPPVVDRKTGRRAHAGEDFNCRCLAVGVIE